MGAPIRGGQENNILQSRYCARYTTPMTFQKWVQKQGRGSLKAIERETGLSWSAVHRAYKSGGSMLETAELICHAALKISGDAIDPMSIMRRVEG